MNQNHTLVWHVVRLSFVSSKSAQNTKREIADRQKENESWYGFIPIPAVYPHLEQRDVCLQFFDPDEQNNLRSRAMSQMARICQENCMVRKIDIFMHTEMIRVIKNPTTMPDLRYTRKKFLSQTAA